ncbi:MAG: crossover junction endodeoxyribonuclease RuvC [Candidatus Kerfeldbacteria bacterium CG15_BIG_FIL_POST_REV_8_21_14_020_45_12]|uniref:Crossover junction endodeoxyribonuclease RuvC n=1 Tax=Candidatus Kerfeldbacteria bacterium CG15_BIG_FIL_POST_REV_8_21_14_020_45_12 TaxID=2014247 RepID=A0A2M7H3A1_9BACT|nr:MAG: crossover junction endodeoxyribonuclease RuvC [Candidatus Kerfeldbacteria bacterium CG15_BIG_FIL_POST_REV_8_21_14_020_45_12]PJA93861.1 MAG: crossover junction endodeoxyribonuclease RuvC [Candidatus Kerfeldbacteria bacterium CG_4_9_14_3_um_filter_45_8]
MRVLGIDPGIDLMGFGLIEIGPGRPELIECGVVRTSRELSTAERLAELYTDLSALLIKFGKIDVAGVEELFFAKNVTTAFLVGQARGVILLCLAESKLPIIEIKPVEVKQAMTGSGNADKKEVQKMVQLNFGLSEPPQPDDAADAVAVAVAAGAMYKRNQQQNY